MTDIELKKRYIPIAESWLMIKEFQNATGADEECEKLEKRVDEVYEKSGKSKFAKDIMAATVNEIDRIMTEARSGKAKDSL